LKQQPLGHRARIIAEITEDFPGQVILNTALGTQRIVDMLTSEPLPRIC
jgi:hydrogenase expression/formation protein HypE